MKKIHILGLALFAMLAFSSIAVTAAFGEITLLAEWLINSAAVTELTSIEISGLLLLVDTKGALGAAAGAHCEGLFKGSVGANGEDEITEILSVSGVAIGSSLTGTSLECSIVEDPACAGSPAPLLWVNNLPWGTLLFLMANGQILDAIGVGGKEPQYELECTVFGVKAIDTCTGKSSTLMENMAGENDVLGIFNAESEHGSCTLGGAATAEIVGEGLIFTLSGLPIAVSSEG